MLSIRILIKIYEGECGASFNIIRKILSMSITIVKFFFKIATNCQFQNITYNLKITTHFFLSYYASHNTIPYILLSNLITIINLINNK